VTGKVRRRRGVGGYERGRVRLKEREGGVKVDRVKHRNHDCFIRVSDERYKLSGYKKNVMFGSREID
jgi:hypothetical protein